MGDFIDFTKTVRARGAYPSPWYFEDFSRPIFQHVCKDKPMFVSLIDRMLWRLNIRLGRGRADTKKRIALGRIILDLYVRHSTTGGKGSLGVFTSNSTQVSGSDSHQYKMLGVCGVFVHKVVQALEAKEFVILQKGAPRHSTKIKATPGLINFLETLGLCMEGIGCKHIWPVVWSPEKNKDGKDEGRIAYERVPKEKAEGRGLRIFQKHNSILRRSDIRVGSRPLYPYEKQVKRIFKDLDCELFGRIHGGIWQNIPGGARHFITINGEGTAEVDISSTHPLIAYALNGYDLTEIIKTEGKPYEIDVLSSVESTDREINKQALINCLNAESQVKAQQGLWSKIQAHRDRYTLRFTWRERYRELNRRGIAYPQIVESLRQKHYRIENYMFKESWKTLSIYESEIALRVIQHFNSRGMPVLSIHDSFIVPHEKVQELKSVLVLAIEEVLGPFKNKDSLCDTKLNSGHVTLREAEDMLTQTRIHRGNHKLSKSRLVRS